MSQISNEILEANERCVFEFGDKGSLALPSSSSLEDIPMHILFVSVRRFTLIPCPLCLAVQSCDRVATYTPQGTPFIARRFASKLASEHWH